MKIVFLTLLITSAVLLNSIGKYILESYLIAAEKTIGFMIIQV